MALKKFERKIIGYYAHHPHKKRPKYIAGAVAGKVREAQGKSWAPIKKSRRRRIQTQEPDYTRFLQRLNKNILRTMR